MRGEEPMVTINRELTELVERGWEPVAIESTAPTLSICVLLKKVSS